MASEFQREERYCVVKFKDLSYTQINALMSLFQRHEIPMRECVVVEADWPIYEETWENVQRLAEGRPSIGQERSVSFRQADQRAGYWKYLAENMAKDKNALAAHVTALAACLEALNAKLADIKSSLYGQGFRVSGWHMNGDLESIDSWFEENDWEPESCDDENIARWKARIRAEYAGELAERLPEAVHESAVAGGSGSGLLCDSASSGAWGDVAASFLENESNILRRQAEGEDQ